MPLPRDDDFVDRASSQESASGGSQTLLEQIEEKCARPAARVALVGIGGWDKDVSMIQTSIVEADEGRKSRVAIEYCHFLRQRSPNVWVFRSIRVTPPVSRKGTATSPKRPAFPTNGSLTRTSLKWLRDGCRMRGELGGWWCLTMRTTMAFSSCQKKEGHLQHPIALAVDRGSSCNTCPAVPMDLCLSPREQQMCPGNWWSTRASSSSIRGFSVTRLSF